MVLLGMVLVVVAGTLIYLNYKAVIARHKIPETKNYAAAVSDITIPEGTVIVGLGEASHGNVEFQELRLAVFQNLVENYGFRAFGLELDYGEGLLLNDYIQGRPSENLAQSDVITV